MAKSFSFGNFYHQRNNQNMDFWNYIWWMKDANVITCACGPMLL